MLAGLATASCAFSNYDFDELAPTGGDSRGERLAAALAAERAPGEHRDLYDVRVIPLAHTSLKILTDESDEELPAGHVEMDLDAYLPFFGFVDASVRHYDGDHRLYERNDHNSYAWGLFQTHREQVATIHGLREQTERTILWIFDWTSAPRFVEE